MSNKNIIFEGWLTKSPPTKRIWRTKWRRRWFSLRKGDLPGQYYLDYYVDRQSRHLKGSIDLDFCEQVDAGLHMDRTSGSMDPKLRGSVFTIQTNIRLYHLEADNEDDMEKWVDTICQVCGLKATNGFSHGTYQNSVGFFPTLKRQYGAAKNTGPYIPISECITGVRTKERKRAFTFDPRSVVASNRDGRYQSKYNSRSHIQVNDKAYSDNESVSDGDDKSLNSHLGSMFVIKSFTKLQLPKNNEEEPNVADPPPVPPRPPKTFQRTIIRKTSAQKESAVYGTEKNRFLNVPSQGTQRSLSAGPRLTFVPAPEEEVSPHLPTKQYVNLVPMPPVVDRALKPRRLSQNFHPGYCGQANCDEAKAVTLQYLDLDLHSTPSTSSARRNSNFIHGKSLSVIDAESPYKTVDFAKTEALNITMQDAEASRSLQY